MAEGSSSNLLNLKTLREQVYDYLRLAMNKGELAPGTAINLNEISGRLGISRTPLRDALLQLELEGFVTILPRRGCVVNGLTQTEICHLYQVIGALESSVIYQEFDKMRPPILQSMARLNEEMRDALGEDDFDRYYENNLRLHDCYLDLTANTSLRRIVRTMKQRLYDFPRRQAFIKEWEVNSTGEHQTLIRLIESGDREGAARYVRDVHWSYEFQRPFVERYYVPETRAAGRRG